MPLAAGALGSKGNGDGAPAVSAEGPWATVGPTCAAAVRVRPFRVCLHGNGLLFGGWERVHWFLSSGAGQPVAMVWCLAGGGKRVRTCSCLGDLVSVYDVC